jgi:hypothetical protein
MHEPPASTTWNINCGSGEEAQALQRWLSGRIDLDRVFTDTVRVIPDGMEQIRTVQYRLGDYFVEIRVLPLAQANPTSFRLVFNTRADAGRFWKDLMVNILQEIGSTPHKASVSLDANGQVGRP